MLQVPEKFKEKPEAKFWEEYSAHFDEVSPREQYTLEAICRARAEEEMARREFDCAVGSGDVTGAKMWAAVIKDCRSQSQKFLDGVL